LDAGERGAVVQFRGDKYANPAGLVTYLEGERGLAKIRDNKLVIRRDWRGDDQRVKGAFAIARDLAKLAKAAG
ncbi:MAG: hypothetical protein AAGF90_10560, partial [Pseudomonadota bacterium]